MKRLFFILFFFSLLALWGCGREESILDYQTKSIKAECIINGKYGVLLEKNEQGRAITVQEPEEAAGISFIIGEKITAVSGDTRIELDKDALGGICAIGEIFSQEKECLTNASSVDGGSVLTFSNDGRIYQITLGKNSLPHYVRISSKDFEYEIEILSIELT